MSNFNANSSSRNDPKGKCLVRKPSIKNKKPPEVRQTLTSKYRLLKANPLLANELEKAISKDSKEPEIKPLKSLVNALDSRSTTNKPKINIFPKRESNLNQLNVSRKDFKPGNFLSSTIIDNKREPVKKEVKIVPKGTTNKTQIKQSKSVRRSLSADHFERKKTSTSTLAGPKKPLSTSNEELRNTKSAAKPEEPNISTIIEETSFNATRSPAPHQFVFRTPLGHNRQSVHTPQTAGSRRSLFHSVPNSADMSKRLNEWLRSRGKSLGDFHHLKCFGVHKQRPETPNGGNKENVENNNVTSENFKNLKNQKVEKSNDQVIVITAPVDEENVAREALKDLHKLIKEGYPSEHCEVWLKSIQGKCKKLEEESVYWECRAALEQTKGNISLAVDYYKTAIIQGAEVQAVDHSLDQLLQKFSLLNINTEMRDHGSKDRARIIQDARNIFKSSIIQFAVQERTLKKKSKDGVMVEKQLIATPVRRSTRLSRSAFTSTPGVKVYSTLQEAENSTSHSISFQYNKGFNFN